MMFQLNQIRLHSLMPTYRLLNDLKNSKGDYMFTINTVWID
jgi:hypothetical protein